MATRTHRPASHPYNIDPETLRFSDGTTLAGTFEPLDVYLVGPGGPDRHRGMPMFWMPTHKHWNAVLFPRGGTVAVVIRTGASSWRPVTARFPGRTTVRAFVERMLALWASRFRPIGGRTVGQAMGNHKYFEGMQRAGRGRWVVSFGS